MAAYSIRNQLKRLQPSPGVKMPALDELVQLCTETGAPVSHIAYPSDRPVFWIKYGDGIDWSEVVAQDVAHQELQHLDTSVRAPGIFCAYEIETRQTYQEDVYIQAKTFIIMEYMPGRTAKAYIEQQPQMEHTVYQLIARAIMMLNQVPVPSDKAPSSISGGRIRHTIFGDNVQAPRTYKTVQQLQDHFNLFLAGTKNPRQFSDLAKEPLIFCYSDIHLDNFIIDDRDQISVVDFADTSYLPSSFQKFDLLGTREKLGFDLTAIVKTPATQGIDNTAVLFETYPSLVVSFSSFVKAGKMMP
ncbi:uncharacterized protein B0I36DRAFT_240911 [Microdochium trichocladiopsis]|uniref:Aminoglycoside phosphotransferase domain-containing protein n=1 Tax=Microdochium trichocladiopsis TaxID=1682393 RepID=A0A9P8Y8E3_9PEZI|nr:uncharacterized protein B0I36DRAFT_240911 [Microdochium trichocladiopsis]KAH7033064.1 hypothetical protein B0I36DRAFT_240911 [Microdochium trichocladiopsis]